MCQADSPILLPLESWTEAQAPWEAAYRLLDLGDTTASLLTPGDRELMQWMTRLHQQTLDQERVLEVTIQGLRLERDVMARKLREVESFATRCKWGEGLGETEARIQQQVRHILLSVPE